MLMRMRFVFLLILTLIPASLPVHSAAQTAPQATPSAVFGYSDFSKQARIEEKFLAVPSAKLAGEHLKTLTAEPHLASTPEDRKTAEYVAQKFRAAGLDTEIVPYSVLLNQPKVVRVEAYDAAGKLLMTGPAREHVQGDAFPEDSRVVMPFNGSSGSGDVTGEVVYANYGRLEDFDELERQHIDMHGKIVITRYGANFRGVKVYIAEKRGAAGVIIYSDPQDDGYFKGDPWPMGPWRPDNASPGRYDADLLRVRRVRVTLRVQTANASYRGPAGALFARGGTSNGGERYVPDQEITFDVAPRNLGR